MEPMNNFTPRAQQVLALARKEADRFHHNYVGTEHLLLGLIKLGQGVAVSVLQKMGLDLETVRAEVEKQVGIGQESKTPVGSIPEYVIDGANGLLVPPADVPKLVEAIERLVAQDEQRKYMGRLARATVEPLCVKQYSNRMCAVYRSLSSNNARRAARTSQSHASSR